MLIHKLQARSYRREVLKRGFTLPEVLVSVAIFSIVATIAISAIITTADFARRTQAQRTLIDNLDFALENFSRRIRVGSDYLCYATPPAEVPADGAVGANCQSDGGRAVAFLSPADVAGDAPEEVMYYYERDAENKGALYYKKRGVEPSRLTAQNINITDARFYISGVGSGGSQPRVLVIIRGEVPGKAGVPIPFDVQTTISQRKLED